MSKFSRTLDEAIRTCDGFWQKLSTKNGYTLFGQDGILWHISKGNDVGHPEKEFEKFDMNIDTDNEKVANRKAIQYFERWVAQHSR